MTSVSFCILGRISTQTRNEQHWLAAVRGLGASVQGAAVCGFVHLQFCYQNSPLCFCHWLERVIVAKVITESLWVRMGAGSKPSNCVLVLKRWALRPCWICAAVPSSWMWNPARAMELRGAVALRVHPGTSAAVFVTHTAVGSKLKSNLKQEIRIFPTKEQTYFIVYGPS